MLGERDGRNWERGGCAAGLDGVQPGMKVGAKGRKGDAAEGWRKGVEFMQGAGEQGERAGAVAGLVVVECDGDLDHGLEKGLFGPFKGEPCALPMLVREEELGAAEADEALGKRSGFPVERHRGIITDGVWAAHGLRGGGLVVQCSLASFFGTMAISTTGSTPFVTAGMVVSKSR